MKLSRWLSVLVVIVLSGATIAILTFFVLRHIRADRLEESKLNLNRIFKACKFWVDKKQQVESNKYMLYMPSNPSEFSERFGLRPGSSLENPRSEESHGYMYVSMSDTAGFMVTELESILAFENMPSDYSGARLAIFVNGKVAMLTKERFETILIEMRHKYPDMIVLPIVF